MRKPKPKRKPPKRRRSRVERLLNGRNIKKFEVRTVDTRRCGDEVGFRLTKGVLSIEMRLNLGYTWRVRGKFPVMLSTVTVAIEEDEIYDAGFFHEAVSPWFRRMFVIASRKAREQRMDEYEGENKARAKERIEQMRELKEAFMS